eukprot:SAG11_NODE_5491_length_1546_cov_4.865930_1_plen_211_part_00
MYTPGSGFRGGDYFVALPGPGSSDSLTVFRRNAPAGSTPAFARPALRSYVHGWAAADDGAALGALILWAGDPQTIGEVFRNFKGGGEGFAPMMRGCGGRHQASRSPWLCRGKINASLNPSPGWTKDLKARWFSPCVKNTSPCVEPLNTQDFLISGIPVFSPVFSDTPAKSRIPSNIRPSIIYCSAKFTTSGACFSKQDANTRICDDDEFY